MVVDVKFVKIGNSLTLRIPKLVVQHLHLQEGSEAELILENSDLIIRPKHPHSYSLEELLEDITPQNCHIEQFNDTPKGMEVL